MCLYVGARWKCTAVLFPFGIKRVGKGNMVMLRSGIPHRLCSLSICLQAARGQGGGQQSQRPGMQCEWVRVRARPHGGQWSGRHWPRLRPCVWHQGESSCIFWKHHKMQTVTAQRLLCLKAFPSRPLRGHCLLCAGAVVNLWAVWLPVVAGGAFVPGNGQGCGEV